MILTKTMNLIAVLGSGGAAALSGILITVACALRLKNHSDEFNDGFLYTAAVFMSIWAGLHSVAYSMEDDRKAGIRRMFGLLSIVILAVAAWILAATANDGDPTGNMTITVRAFDFEKKDGTVLVEEGVTIIPIELVEGEKNSLRLPFDVKCLEAPTRPAIMDPGVAGDNTVNGLIMIAFILAAIPAVSFAGYREMDEETNPDAVKGDGKWLLGVQGLVSALISVAGIWTTVMLFSDFERFPDEVTANTTDVKSEYDDRTDTLHLFGTFMVLVFVHDLVNLALTYNFTGKGEQAIQFLCLVGDAAVFITSFLMANALDAMDTVQATSGGFMGSSKDEIAQINTLEKNSYVPLPVTSCETKNYNDYETDSKVMSIVFLLALIYAWRAVNADRYTRSDTLVG